MSAVFVLKNRGEWQVWISLNENEKPPDGNNFIIGLGATRNEAVADAVADLEAVLDELQGPALDGE